MKFTDTEKTEENHVLTSVSTELLPITQDNLIKILAKITNLNRVYATEPADAYDERDLRAAKNLLLPELYHPVSQPVALQKALKMLYELREATPRDPGKWAVKKQITMYLSELYKQNKKAEFQVAALYLMNLLNHDADDVKVWHMLAVLCRDIPALESNAELIFERLVAYVNPGKFSIIFQDYISHLRRVLQKCTPQEKSNIGKKISKLQSRVSEYAMIRDFKNFKKSGWENNKNERYYNAIINHTQNLWENGKEDKAIQELEVAITACPSRLYKAKLQFSLANFYLILDRFDKAEPLFLAAYDIFSLELNNAKSMQALILNCLFNLAEIFIEQDRKVEAIAKLEEALTFAWEKDAVMHSKVRTQYTIQQLKKEVVSQSTEQFQGNCLKILTYVPVLRKDRDFEFLEDKAVDVKTKLGILKHVQVSTKHPLPNVKAAAIDAFWISTLKAWDTLTKQQRQEAFSQALTLQEELKKIHPRHAEKWVVKKSVYLCISRYYGEQGEYRRAEKMLEELLYLDPHNVDIWLEVANLYHVISRPEFNPVSIYEKLMQLDPYCQISVIRIEYARYLKETKGNIEDALVLLKTQVEYFKQRGWSFNYHAYFNCVQIYVKYLSENNNISEAIKEINELIRNCDISAAKINLKILLVRVYVASNNFASAQVEYMALCQLIKTTNVSQRLSRFYTKELNELKSHFSKSKHNASNPSILWRSRPNPIKSKQSQHQIKTTGDDQMRYQSS